MAQSRRITRRESVKACLVPVGMLTANWLLGCGSDARGSGEPLAAASGGIPQTSGSTSTPPTAVGADATPPASAGSSPVSAAGAPAPAAGRSAAGALGGSAGASGSSQMSAAGASGGAGVSTAGSGGAAAAGSGALAAAGGNGGVAGAAVMWASGGTKAMQGNYPNPFETGMLGATCTVYPTQTIGPCYEQMPAVRQDISDGQTGLPLRLSFLVVRSNGCTPVANASIDIWHSGSAGIYSAYASRTICNPGTTNVRDQMFCRGVQMTDALGRADINTVFPGWYIGRTIHIHFTVRVDGRSFKTSQLYFEDKLTDEILTQGEYAARGERDTTNARDFEFRTGGASADQIVFNTAKRPDGVLHAWKMLAIA